MTTVYQMLRLDEVKVFPNLGYDLDPEYERFSEFFFHILKLDTWLYEHMKFH
jgi:hypothetical protein